MVYNDKLNSSFALEISIDLNSTQYDRRSRYKPGIGTLIAENYKMYGNITLAGDLIITASSPQYGEKIWKKSIKLTTLSFQYQGSESWDHQATLAEELREDNVVYNAFTRELEQYYQQALNLAWQQIDVAEMVTVAQQAKKADKKGS
jgi:hypothetical protein